MTAQPLQAIRWSTPVDLAPQLSGNDLLAHYGSPLVSGYDPDYGDVYGLRSDGQTYGWNITHTAYDRDRNKISDQLLDTLINMRAGAAWTINVPNGAYDVKVSVGDAAYASTDTINVRVGLGSPDDVDDDLVELLTLAYGANV